MIFPWGLLRDAAGGLRMAPPAQPDRRAALGGVLAVAALSGARTRPVSAPRLQPRIDVHAHYLPEIYRRAALAAGLEHADGIPGLPRSDTDAALGMMEALNTRTAMLSVSSPGVHFGDDAAARRLAREVNKVGAKAASDHPGRFGLFASLPLPDIDGAIAEATYALDTLGADGVTVESNHQGIYVGIGDSTRCSPSCAGDARWCSCIRPRRAVRAARPCRWAIRGRSSSSCSRPPGRSPTCCSPTSSAS